MNKRPRKLFWFFLALFVAAVVFLIGNYYGQHGRDRIYEQMAENKNTGTPVPEKEPEVTEAVQGKAEPTDVPVEIPIDFESLKKQNPDIYAWITIPDTKIDYPIVQREDVEYYLNHTVDGQEGLPGAIYTEGYNSQAFTDKNTVIYGHNMRDGTMFGELKSYKNRAYREEHPQIIIYTPEHIFTYEIFAAVTYDDRHILKSFYFGVEDQAQEFLDSLKQVRNMSSYVCEEIPVDASDRILTLSTCNNNDKERFLVEAVLIDEQ